MHLIRCTVLALAIFACSLAHAGGPFNGSWQNCQWFQQEKRDICSIAVMHQRGRKVCGFWYYSATYRDYEGRFTAKVAGETLTWTRVCGRPGSRATYDCPDPSDNAAFMKSLGAEPQWSTTNGRSLLCNGSVYEFEDGVGPTTCSEIQRLKLPQGLVKRSSRSKKFAPGGTKEDASWLNSCLAS
jgi:hypothetical protein